MNLHWLQHVPFEGLGYIKDWAEEQNARISCTRFHKNDALPEMAQFDWLIVMGGPMGIFDDQEYPWLTAEKRFIKQAIDSGKIVIGICLGAQLMAHVLGAKVYPGPQKEIGWFPITREPDAPEIIPGELTVFHWHGDTFDLPAGAQLLARSEPGIHQGFVYNQKAVGLQFHMETTAESMDSIIQHCADELCPEAYIQTAEEMKAQAHHIPAVNQTIKNLLNALL